MLISKQRRENDLFSNFLNIDTADAVLTFDFIKKRKRYKYFKIFICILIVHGTSSFIERLFCLCRLIDEEKKQNAK